MSRIIRSFIELTLRLEALRDGREALCDGQEALRDRLDFHALSL